MAREDVERPFDLHVNFGRGSEILDAVMVEQATGGLWLGQCAASSASNACVPGLVELHTGSR